MFPPLVIFLVCKAAHSLIPSNESVFCVPVAEEEGGHRKAGWGNRQLENFSFSPKWEQRSPWRYCHGSKQAGVKQFPQLFFLNQFEYSWQALLLCMVGSCDSSREFFFLFLLSQSSCLVQMWSFPSVCLTANYFTRWANSLKKTDHAYSWKQQLCYNVGGMGN